MNILKKKSLHVAVLAGLAAVGAAGTAEAVHINPDGLGQVLIFPYYTARAGQFTAISIVNTQANTKLVKVRFLEGKNSKEVLDFNLFLSPSDVWTGAVVDVPATGGARLISNDNSCVTPSDLFAETRTDALGSALNSFKNYEYAVNLPDNSTMFGLDRTREGYFEVIEMGVVDDTPSAIDVIAGTAATLTGYIKHNSAGVPANCGALDAYDGSNAAAAIKFPNVGANLLQPPRGGLGGRASIINSATGSNFTFSPTVLDAWSNIQAYTIAGSTSPKLVDALPATSNIFTANGVVTANWGAILGGAVAAVLTRNTVQNEFILDAGTQSSTDWIVTFPTKRYQIKDGAGAAPAVPVTLVGPFANNFHTATNDGACDPYNVSVFNREEQTPSGGSFFVQPSPLPTITVTGSQLCWEANVVPFGTASLLGSTNTNPLVANLKAFVTGATSVAVAPTTPSIRGTQGPNGWMLMNFNFPDLINTTTNVQAMDPVSGSTTAFGGAAVAFGAVPSGRHFGLPVVGAMVHNYKNTGVVSTYGAVVDHKFTRLINP